MLKKIKTLATVHQRTFKNFGHKRQPIPVFTTVWHGFLTCTFMGLALEWNRIKTFFFGDENQDVFLPADPLSEE